MPLKKFDEVRLAISAIEMSQNHQWFITYYDGLPEMWSVKPPLLIWIQVLFIKLIGINELAIRLPSALAALTICFIIYRFIINEFQNKWIASFSVLILITSNGFVHSHGARSGDYDTFLCLFLLIQALSFYKYIQTENIKYIIYFSIGIILACMTKGITGLLFLPGFFIYIAIEKKYKFIIDWKLMLGYLVSIAVVLAYYFYRETLAVGYLKAVYENELGGRFLKSLEGHQHEWWFYFVHFFNFKFTPWYFLMIIGLMISKLELSYTLFIRFSSCLILSFLFIISSSQTKIIWYDMPIYPLISMIAGIGIFAIYQLIRDNKRVYANLFIALCMFATYIPMFIQCYKPMIPEGEMVDYKLCYFIKNNSELISKNKKIHLVYDGYNPQIKFYEYYLQDKNPNIVIAKSIEKSTVLYVSNEELKTNIERKYNLKSINKFEAGIYSCIVN
jgi:4-amino-4-deoxy-L-arabinose transferase-like glycosyltransferase